MIYMLIIIKPYCFIAFYNKILISYMTSTKRKTKVICFSNVCYFIAIAFAAPIIVYYIVFLKFIKYIV